MTSKRLCLIDVPRKPEIAGNETKKEEECGSQPMDSAEHLNFIHLSNQKYAKIVPYQEFIKRTKLAENSIEKNEGHERKQQEI